MAGPSFCESKENQLNLPNMIALGLDLVKLLSIMNMIKEDF
jgi:hypothetical protein